MPFDQANITLFWERIRSVAADCISSLVSQGFSADDITIEPFLNMRYDRTDCALMTPPSHEERAIPAKVITAASSIGDFRKAFEEQYQLEFGFCLPTKIIRVDDIRVRAIGHTPFQAINSIRHSPELIAPFATAPIYFDAGSSTVCIETPLYDLTKLKSAQPISGPAILVDVNNTVVVDLNCTAVLSEAFDLTITLGDGKPAQITSDLDMIHLSLFGHRFMSIAEQMGRTLQRTSISTNIKVVIKTVSFVN